MKNNKGITLIALVVTIIVLLILAGVSIAMLTGQNGILNRASQASVANEIGDAKDKVALEVNNAVSEYYAGKYTGANVTVSGEDKITGTSGNADLAKLIKARLTTLKSTVDTGKVTMTLKDDTESNPTKTTITITSNSDSTNTASVELSLTDGTFGAWTNNY